MQTFPHGYQMFMHSWLRGNERYLYPIELVLLLSMQADKHAMKLHLLGCSDASVRENIKSK